MKKKVFFQNLKDEFETEVDLNGETVIKDLPEWDSLNAMVLIGYLSKTFDYSLSADELNEVSTINDLINLIGKSKFE